MHTLQVICLVLTYSGLAVPTYDEHMTCGRSYKQMRLIQNLPCDFKHQNWCESPGESYPWSAMRSFLLENQGLMRRMYGAIRQRTLLRAEFETNNINVGTGRHSNNLFEFSEKIPVDTKVNPNQKHPSTAFPQPTRIDGEKATSSASSSSSTPTTETLPHTSPEVTTQSNSPQATTAGPTETTLLEKEELGGLSLTTDNGLWTAEEVFTTLAMSEPTLVTGFGVSESTTLDSDDYEDVTSRIQDRIDLDAFLEGEPLPSSDPIPAPPITVADGVGVNACPVKEEVVAPYWANNTRGEVLALLNLYPFEQYVHWEKCTYEHRQMFCRDGCRCEQQYRLHRMLAFDPNNECRGIFSDWFKFPSCCVCKCYNLTRNLYNSRKMAFQRDSSEIETDELIEEEDILVNEPRASQKQARSSHPEPELYEPLKEARTDIGNQEENMVKVENRQLEVPEDKTRTDIKPVEVSINSLTYKITGLKNFRKLFENVRQSNTDLNVRLGKSKPDAPKLYSPAVLPNVQVREWTWPVRRFRGSKRQPRTMP